MVVTATLALLLSVCAVGGFGLSLPSAGATAGPVAQVSRDVTTHTRTTVLRPSNRRIRVSLTRDETEFLPVVNIVLSVRRDGSYRRIARRQLAGGPSPFTEARSLSLRSIGNNRAIATTRVFITASIGVVTNRHLVTARMIRPAD